MQTLKYVSKASKITFISCKYITDGITRHIVGTLAGQYLDEIVSVFILQNTSITFGLWMILFFSVKFQLLSILLKNIYVHEQTLLFFISQLKKQLHIHVYVNSFFFYIVFSFFVSYNTPTRCRDYITSRLFQILAVQSWVHKFPPNNKRLFLQSRENQVSAFSRIPCKRALHICVILSERRFRQYVVIETTLPD